MFFILFNIFGGLILYDLIHIYINYLIKLLKCNQIKIQQLIDNKTLKLTFLFFVKNRTAQQNCKNVIHG